MGERIDELRTQEAKATMRTLLGNYRPPLIAKARAKQDQILTERFKGGAHRIADLGCGDGYHGLIFGPSSVVYHGYEISTELADIARQQWSKAGLTQAKLLLGDLAHANPAPHSYDLVFCLYFTPGNFRDFSEDLSLYTDAYLDRNPMFIRIFKAFHDALVPGGKLFLTVYRDNPTTEALQRDFYEKTGHVLSTPPGLRFVATQQHFWSVRFTPASIRSNLTAVGAQPANITLHELNAIAWLVEVERG